MTERQGNLSINSENMLPIIKKWLYSDHDIFVREVISNACDAISKLHKLEIMGEYQYPDDHKDSIHVVVDPDAKTVSFSDTGLGMTADEVEEYITQIAFSGATAFFEKYKDKANKDDIIGHFGLGFYSVFMVAEDGRDSARCGVLHTGGKGTAASGELGVSPRFTAVIGGDRLQPNSHAGHLPSPAGGHGIDQRACFVLEDGFSGASTTMGAAELVPVDAGAPEMLFG